MTPEAASHPAPTAVMPAPGLHWRIKDSFVRYVLSGPDGAYAVTEGAEDDAKGNFYFPLASATRDDDGVWTLAVAGDVRFSGHMGVLFVCLAGLVVRIGAEGGELSIAGMRRGDRSCIAELPGAEPLVLEDMLVWPELVPALTEEGVGLFGDVYPIGSPLDPLRILAGVR